MNRIEAQSSRAAQAYAQVSALQQRFVARLERIGVEYGKGLSYAPTEWLRDRGRHGGGIRYMAVDDGVFNRASVNISQVHYDDEAAKPLGSASAISTIIHPANPLAASVHIHISWTEMKDGSGYWRIMADLNPAVPDEADRRQFMHSLQQAAPQHYAEAAAQGDQYFYIPVLQRHRGTTHFYLEHYSSGDFAADLALARQVGEAAIDSYCAILSSALATRSGFDAAELQAQLDYHSLYFFQVLTLDRGTTSGLLVHDQNDIGILASLPARVNRVLLASWATQMPEPQNRLLLSLLACLPEADICAVDDDSKQALANCLRQHYTQYPQALALQASGNTIPPTVQNHR
jgi:coproporphyrinogen III oxidase